MTTQDTTTPEIKLPPMPHDVPYQESVLVAYARAAIAHDRQQRGEPSGYAYRYSSHDGGTVIRFNNGVEVNGSRPIESVPYWFAPQPADPVRVPSDEELIAWATEEEFFLFCDEDEFLQIARALLARYGAPVAAQEPVGYLPAYEVERLKSGHSGNVRSAKFGPSKLDGDVSVYLNPQPPTSTQPENIRAGDPYDDPEFESLCREHQIWGTAASALCAVFWRAGRTGGEPDMFWNADDPEQCSESLHDVVIDADGNRGLEVGDIVEVQQAKRLPNISVRITSVPDDDSYDSIKYEEIGNV